MSKKKLDLCKASLVRFTDDPDFHLYMDITLNHIRRSVEEHKGMYSGSVMANLGMPMLASHCAEKAGRIFNYVTGRKGAGKGKFEDELHDLLMFSFYIFTYYHTLKNMIAFADKIKKGKVDGKS